MAVDRPFKPLYWVATSKKDLKALPASVIDVFGFALHLAQRGSQHTRATLLKDFGKGVFCVIESHMGDTYRTVYTVRYTRAIYVLHCFQKKPKTSTAMSKSNVEKIRERLQAVEAFEQGMRNDWY